ncbi:unnamed protein product [Urochloa humidicola]
MLNFLLPRECLCDGPCYYTNRPSELDEVILNRFTQIFEIGIPVQSERSKILKVVQKGENVEPNIDYDHIARLCDCFTGSTYPRTM